MADYDLRNLVERATVETTLMPPLVLNQPFAPGPPNPLLQMLRPRITLRVAGSDVVLAPYGDPGVSRWPVVKVVGMTIGGLLLGAALRRMRGRR